jgi:hypothetical protein
MMCILVHVYKVVQLRSRASVQFLILMYHFRVHDRTLYQSFNAYPWRLQLTSSFDNFSQHEVLLLAHLVAWHNHDQITNIGHFRFVVCHEFARILHAFVVLGVHAVSVDCHIDRLLHLVRHDLPHQRSSRILSRLSVHKFPARNGGRVGELFVRHVGNVGKVRRGA